MDLDPELQVSMRGREPADVAEGAWPFTSPQSNAVNLRSK